MLTLKEYQQHALDVLRAYFDECARLGEADTAFYRITRAQFGTGISYRDVQELPGLPYVCLRIPTGGGKTVVAAHAVGVAERRLLSTDHGVVLWLVPSTAIRQQTLAALKDRSHPYRQALENTVGAVTVLDVMDALYVQPPTLADSTVVIVSTMQAFRVEDTEGRKVYESSGSLMTHFTAASPLALTDLEQREDGSVAYSLANLLRMRRPIVIVDEAHNARTPLSFGTLARFKPSCILEFTATPDTTTSPSNILYSASAAELQAADMIKMPILLSTRPDWKDTISDAVARLTSLEIAARSEARATGEFVRPIMLLQAQPDRKGRDSLTVGVVEKCLLEDHRIPAEQIARATGADRGLDGVDLLAPDCKVRFVITIQALREGWDCPFAYVLCTVAEISSPTAIEQILGRVMRLPHAKRKQHPDLNRAYAFAASTSFATVATMLTDALVEHHGFARQEAKDLIVPIQPQQPDLPLFSQPNVVTVAEPPVLTNLSPQLAAKVAFDPATRSVTIKAPIDDQEREALKACFQSETDRAAVALLCGQLAAVLTSVARSPAQRGEILAVPVLAIKQGNLFEAFEDTHFLDHEWNLAACDAALSESKFPSEVGLGKRGEITVTQDGHLQANFVEELRDKVALLDADQGWSVVEFVNWLDRTIPHPDITPTESGIFLNNLVTRLLDERPLTLTRLLHDRNRLRAAAELTINNHRAQAREAAYQALLPIDAPTPLIVTPEVVFQFPPEYYPYHTRYDGTYRFSKHYYEVVGDLKSSGEEFECAQFIDSLPEVRYWVKNIERSESCSFWLQTSTDKFYPDFVCLLNDGRYLAVESKGEHLWSNADSLEKRNLGGLWEARSDGRCLFIMPQGKDFGAIRAKIGAPC